MYEDWKSFCNFLQNVVDEWNIETYEDRLSTEASNLRKEIKSKIKPYEHQVGRHLMWPNEREIDLPDKRVVVFLKPPESAGQLVIPVVTVKGKLVRDQRVDAKVVLALFTRSNDGELRAIAYRFERGDDATHGYFHAQLTEKWCLGGEAGVDDGIPEVQSWFPTSVPAVPMDASKAIHVVTSAVISIYGKQETLSALSEHLNRDLRETLKEMRVVASYYP